MKGFKGEKSSMAIKMKYGSMNINITLPKAMLWISGLWLFIMKILYACGLTMFSTCLFNGKDNDSIILISIFSFLFVTTFVRHRWGKLIAGILNIVLALVGIIGTFVTSVRFSTWVFLLAEIIAIIGCVIWILIGCNLINEGVVVNVKKVSPSSS